jgi:hypothetical protein
MGNQSSQTTINSSSVTTKAVSDAFLSITQDISQGIYNSQEISVDCYGDTKNQSCMSCIDFWIKYNKTKAPLKQLSMEQMREVCEGICECKMSNINLSQNINLNLKSFITNSSSQDFQEKIMNSLSQQANSSGQSFYPTETRTSNINKTINKLYTSMTTDSFQSSIQGLKTLQNIKFSGPGIISNVNMNQVTKYISTLLISDKSTSKLMAELTNDVRQYAMSITNAGLATLGLILVQLIVLVLVIMSILYISSLIIQMYTLYVT